MSPEEVKNWIIFHKNVKKTPGSTFVLKYGTLTHCPILTLFKFRAGRKVQGFQSMFRLQNLSLRRGRLIWNEIRKGCSEKDHYFQIR